MLKIVSFFDKFAKKGCNPPNIPELHLIERSWPRLKQILKESNGKAKDEKDLAKVEKSSKKVIEDLVQNLQDEFNRQARAFVYEKSNP